MAESVADGAGDGRLRTHADRPVSSAAEDEFGFRAYADAFSLLINDADTTTPLTVAISGPWGSGKTSLARLIEERLKVEQYWRLGWDEPPVTCWFNAWLHRDADHLGAAFAASVSRDLNRRRSLIARLLKPLPSELLSRARRTWRRVWMSVATAILAVAVLMWLLALVPDLREAQGSLGALLDEPNALTVWAAIPGAIAVIRMVYLATDKLGVFIDAPRSAAAKGNLADVATQVGQFLGQVQRRRRWRARRARRRVVILVDDLERCPADKALDMCEVASNLFGHDDVIVILIADLEMLELAASARYSASLEGDSSRRSMVVGQEFLHKLIQLRFNVPPLPPIDIAASLGLAPRQTQFAGETSSENRTPHPTKPRFPLIILVVMLILSVAAGWAIGLLENAGRLGAINGLFLTILFTGMLGLGFGAWDWSKLRVSERRRRALSDRVDLIMHDDVSKAAPTEAESDVSASKKAASADLRPEDIRVAEYAILRREAEVGFAARLPANPRRAKRMINHHRLLATIAEDRQVFGGEPLLDHHHLAKWVLIVEHWPGLGITLTSTPSKIEALEGVASTDELLAELMSLGRERHDLEELLAILQGPPRLSPVLGRLVRFEPIASAADGDITGEVAETRE